MLVFHIHTDMHVAFHASGLHGWDGRPQCAQGVDLFHTRSGFCHLPRSAPSIVDATPTSPTSVEVTLNPPTNAGPVDSYEVKVCPTTGGDCVVTTCKTAVCTVPGLQPNTPYTVTADAIIDGQRVPTSNTAEVTTPQAGAPALTSVADTSITTAKATAEPPAGATFTQYTFTAKPLSGGPAVVVTSSTPEATFSGLTPATQVRWKLSGWAFPAPVFY